MLNTKLKTLKDALLAIGGIEVYHYFATSKSDRYIIWQEDTEPKSLSADDIKVIQSIQGTVDLFTKIEFDEAIDKIQEKFNELNISFTLNLIDYEEESHYIHYEWIWEI